VTSQLISYEQVRHLPRLRQASRDSSTPAAHEGHGNSHSEDSDAMATEPSPAQDTLPPAYTPALLMQGVAAELPRPAG
jgi:hypothetical protein